MIVVYIILGLIVALLVISALLPNSFNVEKSTVINKPISAVMSRIANLNDYALWNPWQQSDPTATKTITGTPGSPGHKYAWEGKKVGVGALTLNQMDDRNIHFDLEFFKPWKSKAKDNWHFESIGSNETKVIWQNSGQLPWPVARLMGPMISKGLNRQFVEGLNNLKKLCES
jgi:hypothetical protein